jgi:hypothetical protein
VSPAWLFAQRADDNRKNNSIGQLLVGRIPSSFSRFLKKRADIQMERAGKGTGSGLSVKAFFCMPGEVFHFHFASLLHTLIIPEISIILNRKTEHAEDALCLRVTNILIRLLL